LDLRPTKLFTQQHNNNQHSNKQHSNRYQDIRHTQHVRVAYFPKDERERALFEAEFKKRGIAVDVFEPTTLWLRIHQNLPSIGAGTRSRLSAPPPEDIPLSHADLVFQRSVPSWDNLYGSHVASFFTDLLSLVEVDLPVINPIQATLNAQRKHVALFLLARAGLPVPDTFCSPDPIRNVNITNNISAPYVVKTTRGSGGLGVVLAPDKAVAGDLASLFFHNRQVPIIQHFAPAPYDIRILVIGSTALAAIKRTGTIHKHNISLGASPSHIPLSQLHHDEENIAVAATQTLGLEIAGVDLIQTSDGPRILEVNPSPAFYALQQAAHLNVPAHITNHLIHKAKH